MGTMLYDDVRCLLVTVICNHPQYIPMRQQEEYNLREDIVPAFEKLDSSASLPNGTHGYAVKGGQGKYCVFASTHP